MLGVIRSIVPTSSFVICTVMFPCTMPLSETTVSPRVQPLTSGYSFPLKIRDTSLFATSSVGVASVLTLPSCCRSCICAEMLSAMTLNVNVGSYEAWLAWRTSAKMFAASDVPPLCPTTCVPRLKEYLNVAS